MSNGGSPAAERSFAEHLVACGKVQPQAIERAQHLAVESQERLESVLTRLGLVSERDLAEALSQFLHLPLAVAADYPPQPILEEQLGRKFLREAKVLPLREVPEGVVIAMANPLDSYAAHAVRFAVGRPILPQVALPADLEAAHERLYGDGKSGIHQISGETDEHVGESIADDVDRLKDIASEAPVIRLVNLLITQAVEARASDIHIEPMENELRVRYRVDGVLRPVESPPNRLASAMISRVKIMAKLNIAERRLGQDGRVAMAVRGKDIDLRVATTPTIHGESVVIRILDRAHVELDLDSLGFDESVITPFRALCAHPHGILLVTGPTGSGKTTTLYAALSAINTNDKKILTIEDPVEYQLQGVNQVQVKPQIGLTFAGALRSFLRHDPDIIMIGEIRDLETAQIAVQAALTGHLILSTLHTNDAATAVTRLLDMGVEDYLLTSTINGIAGQRLLRKLCDVCSEAYEPIPELVRRLKLDRLTEGRSIVLRRAVGCAQCHHTGYRGRTSIVEVLTATDAIKQAVLKSTDSGQIQKIAVEEGMQTMATHGLKKALSGITTIDEVLRVVPVV
ncbi:MAG TPA: type II secretion system ATPase GspE [Rhizomicrobium sp.]|jgi:general secretion pathway protein E|nr:type II secretion system ATPase GspE [Rhizomicrobium sp.]